VIAELAPFWDNAIDVRKIRTQTAPCEMRSDFCSEFSLYPESIWLSFVLIKSNVRALDFDLSKLKNFVFEEFLVLFI
jgi:hypothetical protein